MHTRRRVTHETLRLTRERSHAAAPSRQLAVRVLASLTVSVDLPEDRDRLGGIIHEYYRAAA